MEKDKVSGIEPNSVTYWESRQVNIGDYESISFGVTSITKFVRINNQESKAEVGHSDTHLLYPHMTEAEALKEAQFQVRRVLDQREKELRLKSNSNGGTSFDTLKKAMDFGVLQEKELGLTSVNESKSKAKDEFDEDFDEFDEPAKPILKSKVKPPVEKKKAPAPTAKKASGFKLKPSGLFATTPKPPKGMGIDPDEEFDI